MSEQHRIKYHAMNGFTSYQICRTSPHYWYVSRLSEYEKDRIIEIDTLSCPFEYFKRYVENKFEIDFNEDLKELINMDFSNGGRCLKFGLKFEEQFSSLKKKESVV